MRQLNISKSLLMSVIALVLVIILAASVTFSWVEGGDKGYVNGNELVISTGSNLTMRQDGKTTNSIIIPACTLKETSSSDGRNYFFPLGGNEPDDEDKMTTSEMTFREGTPKDVNDKYVSVSFELEAGDSIADVYLGAGTIIKCENQNLLNALRMSFNLNDGSEPVVFKPNQKPGVSMPYFPIIAITEDGVPTTTSVNTKPYGDYYFKGEGMSTPIFSLEKNETLNITLSIWLEGTEFSGSAFDKSDLDIYIDFTTTVDDLVKYTFIDNTHGYSDATAEYWISNTDDLNGNSYETMMYLFDNTTDRYYAMNKVDQKTWNIYVPNTIKNFYFRRYSIDIDQWWNEWEPDMTDIKTDPNGTHTFIAICGNGQPSGTELAGCRGYWQDELDTIRVYFQLENDNWTDLHCYAWGANDFYPLEAWPGTGMTHSHDNGSGNSISSNKPFYYIDIPNASKVTGIEFNNGSGSSNSQKIQITDSQFIFNGIATWGKSNALGDYGHWLYQGDNNSLIKPHIQ